MRPLLRRPSNESHPTRTKEGTSCYLAPVSSRAKLSLASPAERMTFERVLFLDMRDEKTIRQRLEQLRGQLLQWATPKLPVFAVTKDEVRGWIRVLEWILGKR